MTFRLGILQTEKYVETIRTECLKLKEKGVKSLHLRVDADYSGGIIDTLQIDGELINAFDVYEVFDLIEKNRSPSRSVVNVLIRMRIGAVYAF